MTFILLHYKEKEAAKVYISLEHIVAIEEIPAYFNVEAKTTIKCCGGHVYDVLEPYEEVFNIIRDSGWDNRVALHFKES